MADIEKILDGLNIPKQILDKSTTLIKALFGPSLDEFGGLISDNVRLRRFKNQIKIFSKAQDILKDKKIDPKKISLKVLAPLIEFSSYEEEEKLQSKWAKLISHILEGDNDLIFQQTCISVLNKLSSKDAILIDSLYSILDEKRVQKFERKRGRYMYGSRERILIESPADILLNSIVFKVTNIKNYLNINLGDLLFSLSNLVSLGLLKWETNVEVNAKKSSEDPKDNDIDVDVDVSNTDDFIFTPLGDKFVKVCKQDL